MERRTDDASQVKLLGRRPDDPWFGFARSLIFRPHERSWRSRAKSEQFVGLVIGRLPDGWRAVHAVPAGEHGASIDHVVVGPPGTFAITAKDLTEEDRNRLNGGVERIIQKSDRDQMLRQLSREISKCVKGTRGG